MLRRTVFALAGATVLLASPLTSHAQDASGAALIASENEATGQFSDWLGELCNAVASDPEQASSLACLWKIRNLVASSNDPTVVERTLQFMDTEAQSLKASMHTDLENGRPLELEALNGAVVRMGERLGVPTPANGVIYGLLKAHDLKHRGLLNAG